jgi:heme/copper-type cytochrome/quinol oxidase subunit 4
VVLKKYLSVVVVVIVLTVLPICLCSAMAGDWLQSFAIFLGAVVSLGDHDCGIG